MIYVTERKVMWDVHTFVVEADSPEDAARKANVAWPNTPFERGPYDFRPEEFKPRGDVFQYTESTFPQ
jgi:hypothetical protein